VLFGSAVPVKDGVRLRIDPLDVVTTGVDGLVVSTTTLIPPERIEELPDKLIAMAVQV
jgi:hypothetical protein